MLKDMKNLWIIILLMIGVNALNAQVYSSENNELDTVKTNIRGEIFKTLTITVTEDYNVPNFKRVDVTSACVNGIDNTISLPSPVDSLKGNIVEVTHSDTSSDKNRITTVDVVSAAPDIYDSFLDTLIAFYNIQNNGQTVRFVLSEDEEGNLRWVAVDLSPVVFGDKELTAVGNIRQGNDGDLYAYDSSVSEERKVQYQYTVDSVQEILSMKLELGDRIKVKSSGAEYLVQSDTVTGYTTDSIAVVPTNGLFAKLQPQGKSFKTEWFNGYEEGHLIWNKAGEYAFETSRAGINLNGNEYTDSTTQRGNNVILSQPITATSQLYLYDNVTYTGLQSQFSFDNNAMSPTLIIDINSPTDTAFFMVNKLKQIARSGLTADYTAPKVENLEISVISPLGLVFFLWGPSGEIIRDVFIEGNDFVKKGIGIDFAIFCEFDRLRIANCDTSIHIINGPVSTSTSISFNNTSLIYTKYGVVIDSAASSTVDFNEFFVEIFDSVGVEIYEDNQVSIYNFEAENSGRATVPPALFRLRGNTSDNTTRFYLNNARLQGQFKYHIYAEGGKQINVSESWVSNFTGQEGFIKTLESVESVGIFKVDYPGGPLSSNCNLPNCFGSDFDPNTKVNVLSSTYRNNSVNYIDEFIPDTTTLKSNSRLLLDNESAIQMPQIRYTNPSNGFLTTYAPIELATVQTQSPNFNINANIYSEIYPSGNTKVETIKAKTLTVGSLVPGGQTTGIYAFSGTTDPRNGTEAIAELASYFSVVDLQPGENTGLVSNLYHFNANKSTINGTNRNITNIGGIWIEDQGDDKGTNTIANSYGIKIDDQTADATNTYAIKTGTGLVDFGDNLKLSTYGAGNKSATDLSKTGSGYLSEYATDGTLLESSLTIADFDTLQSQNTTLRDTTAATNTTTIKVGEWHNADTRVNTVTFTVPPGLNIGDTFTVSDAYGNAATNNITIDALTNGYKHFGVSENIIMDIDRAIMTCNYHGPDIGLQCKTE